MGFKNILVPYDGSIPSISAFNKALEISKQHDSNLRVVTCLSMANLGAWYVDIRLNKEIMKEAKDQKKKLFSKLDNIAKKNSIHLDSKIMESNNTVNAIVSFAKSKNTDLIVMGSSGRGKYDKVLLGSVSNGVMQKAKCPVLIIK